MAPTRTIFRLPLLQIAFKQELVTRRIRYELVDKATGEETEADAGTVERATGFKIGYIDWVLERDAEFENGSWEVRIPQHSGDPIGTEDLFVKWNRARQR